MKAIKGFNAKFQCRDFQFEVGTTYTHEGQVEACKSGFHAIPEDQHPLSVFTYYPPAESRYAIVEVAGQHVTDGDKVAAEILTVHREIDVGDLAQEAVDWVLARSNPEGKAASGIQGAATASGDQGCAMVTGVDGRVMGKIGDIDLFAREVVWDGDARKFRRKSIACGTTGVGGIKAGVWYCCKGGKLLELDQ